MPAPAEGRFPTTKWTLISRLRSGDESEARMALDELCTEYHYPLYCYIRRRGFAHHDAQDALHDFLAKLLRLDVFASADETKGRLRTFLATALQRFLANWHRDRPHRQREVSLDEPISGGAFPSGDVEERFRHEGFDDQETPERLFDRKWVLELLERVVRLLEEAYVRQGKETIFRALRPALLAGGSLRGEDVPQLAAQLALSENALRIKLTRLMQEFRATLEEQVFLTVASRSEVADEIAYLTRIVRRE